MNEKKSRIETMLAKIEKNSPTPFKWLRFCRNKTQLQLQKESGVLQGRISAFERNYLRPSAEERTALAKALDIDADLLMFPCDYEQTETD
jgi:transcriptional regulator with XRE-family HTH domain